MKVLIVVDELSVSGGTQKTTLKTSLGLQKLGNDVTVLTSYVDPERCYPELNAKVKLYSLFKSKSPALIKNFVVSNGLFSVLFKTLAFALFINTKFINYDSIIIEDVVGILALFFSFKRKRKIVWYLNNQFSSLTIGVFKGNIGVFRFNFPEWLKVFIMRFMKVVYFTCFSKLDYFLTYDIQNMEKIREIGFDNVKVILPGTDITSENYFPRKNFRKINILSIGTFAFYRRYEDIIEALKIIDRNNDKLINRLIIVGVWDSNPKYYQFLKGILEGTDLRRKVVFISYLDRVQLDRLYKKTNVFVFVNDENTWGLAVAEAIMHGLPVIITNNIGISEILSERECYKVEPRNPQQIARAILNIYQNPSKAYAKEIAAYRKIKSLSWDRFVKRVNSILVLASSRKNIIKSE